MPNSNYNRRYPNQPKPLLEKVANDLPNSYLKAGLDLYNGTPKEGKVLIAGALVIGLFAWLNRKK